MSGILVWEEPEKAMPVEVWKQISADSAPPGVYSPNMSQEDMLKWKAKLIVQRSTDPRVEIRKSVRGGTPGRNYQHVAQCKVVVRPDTISVSMNGTAVFGHVEFYELNIAVTEAWNVLYKTIQSLLERT